MPKLSESVRHSRPGTVMLRGTLCSMCSCCWPDSDKQSSEIDIREVHKPDLESCGITSLDTNVLGVGPPLNHCHKYNV